MGGRGRVVAAVAVVVALLGVGAVRAVQDADALGGWRLERWLRDRPGVVAVDDVTCGRSGGRTMFSGYELLTCATVTTDLDPGALAGLSAELAAYRSAHPDDHVGRLLVRAPWGETVVGFPDDAWVLAAVRAATSIPGHGPVRTDPGRVLVAVPAGTDLVAAASTASRGLPGQGPPQPLADGLALEADGARVHVVAPATPDPLAREAFRTATAATPGVALRLAPDDGQAPSGFVLALPGSAPPDLPDRLTALGVGLPPTRSWTQSLPPGQEDAVPLFDTEDPRARRLEDLSRDIDRWAAGALEPLRRLPGVLAAGADIGPLGLADDPGRGRQLVVDVTVGTGPDPSVVDVVDALPDEVTDVALRTRSGVVVAAGAVLDVRTVAPVLDAVSAGATTVRWVPAAEGGGRARVQADLGEADEARLADVLEALATPDVRAAGLSWADLRVTVDGDPWTYVVGLPDGTVSGGPGGPGPTTAGQALERRLAARWSALVGPS